MTAVRAVLRSIGAAWQTVRPAFAAIGVAMLVGFALGCQHTTDWPAPLIMSLPFLALFFKGAWDE